MKTGGGGIPNDVARLKGARFVSAIEAEDGRRLAEALIKQMTGGDTMTARFLYGEFFEFLPEFKIFLAVNHKPVIRNTDHAIWRRIRPGRLSVPVSRSEVWRSRRPVASGSSSVSSCATLRTISRTTSEEGRKCRK